MAEVFNAKNLTFELRQSQIPEFAWHTNQVDYYLDEDKVSEKWRDEIVRKP